MKLKRLICLITALSFVLSACACGAQKENNSGSAEDTEENQTVVATVNGTDITYGDFAEQMVTVEALYSALSETLTAEEINQKLNEQAKVIIENLISQVILEQKAAEYNISLGKEDERAAQETWIATKERITASVKANYPDFKGKDLEALVAVALENMGISEESVVESARKSALISKLREMLDAQVEPADEAQIQARYDQLLQEQRENFTQSATSFESAALAGTPLTYVPADYRVIHEWDVSFDADVVALLKQLKEIDTKDDSTYEDMLANEKSLLQNKVDEILAALSDGDFDTVYARYNSGESPAVNYVSSATTRFSPAYYDAAMSIAKKGDVANSIIELETGCKLLYWADSMSAGVVPIAQLHDDIADMIFQEEKNENWKMVQALWRQEAQVTIQTDLITYS